MSIKRIGKGFDFSRKKRKVRDMKMKIPRIIANDSLNHFLEGFRKGGGQTDSGKWRGRKRNAKRNEGRKILIDTGALRRDVRVRKTNLKKIVIGTQNIKYARRHNEGLTDSLGRRMPKREFLGRSKKLDKKNKRLILRHIKNILG